MTYYPDLSRYTYDSMPEDLDVGGQLVLNVGWLDPLHPFYPRGWTSGAFRRKLREFCEHTRIRHRGYHYCGLGTCALVRPKGNGIVLIRNGTTWFAAPSLVYHYVTWHWYRPPDLFIQGVLEYDPVNHPPNRRSSRLASPAADRKG